MPEFPFEEDKPRPLPNTTPRKPGPNDGTTIQYPDGSVGWAGDKPHPKPGGYIPGDKPIETK